MEAMYIVYKHTTLSGKVYIGITSQTPELRWKKGSGYRNNKYFTHAINKYGWDNIRHEILFEGLTKDEAEEKEVELIAFYKSNQPKYGYNVAKGGHSNSGFKHSDETKNQIRKSLQGKKHSIERRENQRKAQLKLWSDEKHRKFMSKVHEGKGSGKEHDLSKIVYQYSLSNELLNVFESTRLAEKATGIAHQQISDCCNHKQKTCHGYIWSYEIL